jgi:hypothetical protein
MDKILRYKIFCLESYKNTYNLSGVEVFNIFNNYKVFDYLANCYDVLHSTGQMYAVKDIEQFIAARKN